MTSLEFRRLNQICMGNRDGMQGTGEFARPEVQEISRNSGKVRMQVVGLLPRQSFARCADDQHPIENISGGQDQHLRAGGQNRRRPCCPPFVSGSKWPRPLLPFFVLIRAKRFSFARQSAREEMSDLLVNFMLLASHEIECQLLYVEQNSTLADFYAGQLANILKSSRHATRLQT